MSSRPTVRLYARPDCHLCDEARAVLERMLAAGAAFELEEVDIDGDERLLRRFLEKIPVIELDGEIISELGLDEDSLRARLATVSQ
jgi:glutathione S-transferase